MKNENSIDLDPFVGLLLRERERIAQKNDKLTITKKEVRLYNKIGKQLDVLAEITYPYTMWGEVAPEEKKSE